MARQRLCKVCGGWHDLGQPWPHNCAEHYVSKQAEGLAIPMMNLDTMEPVQSQTNGLFYDSKSTLRKEYKRAGVIEVGNDAPTSKPVTTTADKAKARADRRASAARALSQAGFGAP